MDLCFLQTLKGKATTRSLVASIAEAIDSGLLIAGERLPSSREIAMCVGAARTTVVRAYDELIARGYLSASQGASTVVALRHTSADVETFAPPSCDFLWRERYTDSAQRALAHQGQGGQVFTEPASPHLPIELVPAREWQRIQSNLLARMKDDDGHADPFGCFPLRQAVSDYLRRSKGLLCPADRIVLYNGADQAIDQVLRLLMKEGEAILCDSAQTGLIERLQQHGMEVTAMQQRTGQDLDSVIGDGTAAHWLYVSPGRRGGHSFPLDEAQRNQLLRQAQRHRIAIIEDARRTEFHYASAAAAPPLFTMDRSGAVIYVSDFDMLLHPLCSVGFLLLPERLVRLFQSACSLVPKPPRLEQLALAELISGGHLEKHIHAVWKVLRRRRQTMIFDLKRCLKERIEITAPESGTHLVIRLAPSWTGQDILNAARASLLPLQEAGETFVIDFARVPEEEATLTVEKFTALLQPMALPVTVTPAASPAA